jgi:hypothetical protein
MTRGEECARSRFDNCEPTINQVKHGRTSDAGLIVVDSLDIGCDTTTEGMRGSGGRVRVWTDWTPQEMF